MLKITCTQQLLCLTLEASNISFHNEPSLLIVTLSNKDVVDNRLNDQILGFFLLYLLKISEPLTINQLPSIEKNDEKNFFPATNRVFVHIVWNSQVKQKIAILLFL